MSTIRVNAIQNTSTTDGGISIDNSGHVTLDGQALPSVGPLSNRNIIINGAMQVAQRGTQVTGVTGDGYHTCDRFKINLGNLGTWTVDQDTNAPNGFSNSLKLTCTTADASPAASDYFLCQQKIEAQNLQSLGFGTSDAKPMTLSFWVKSNKTGNASAALLQSDNSNKLASFQYSISSADTWEYKTIDIPADTSGVINNDNGQGLQVEWWLNSGSNYTSGSLQTTWGTFTNTNRNASNLGLGGATSDYWQITGVQLEVGEVATPFEHRSYGDELARCQRYFQGYNATSATARAAIAYDNYDTDTSSNLPTTTLIGVGTIHDGDDARIVGTFSVPMRARPTVTVSDIRIMSGGTLFNTTTIIDSNQSTIYAFSLLVDNASSMTAAQCAHLIIKGNGYLYFDAEF